MTRLRCASVVFGLAGCQNPSVDVVFTGVIHIAAYEAGGRGACDSRFEAIENPEHGSRLERQCGDLRGRTEGGQSGRGLG